MTFDDGYADNLHVALPLLERYQIPATVFVTSAAVGRQREFWWDELEKVLLSPGPLPRELSLEVAGRMHHFDLESASSYEPSEAKAHMGWSMLGSTEPTARHKVYVELFNLLIRRSPKEIADALNALVGWAGLELRGRDSHRTMTRDELTELGASKLVEIGAHTVTHRVLAGVSVPRQKEEIEGSRDELRRVLGRAPSSFAYPYGFASSYDEQTIALVREAGFERACTTDGRPLDNGSDPYTLPRVWPRSSTSEGFQRRLLSFLSS